MIERDLKTLLALDDNYLKASSTYLMLVDVFTQSINIPLFPNIVAVLSIVSLNEIFKSSSKLSSVEDLLKISTLGFRGEALPSIASVSRLEIKSS